MITSIESFSWIGESIVCNQNYIRKPYVQITFAVSFGLTFKQSIFDHGLKENCDQRSV